MNHNPAPVKEPLKLDPFVKMSGNKKTITRQQRLRFFRLLALCEKQAQGLQGVTRRLLEENETPNILWVDEHLRDPAGEDRLESFGARFSRLQDMICDKLIPAFLQASGEKPGTLLDNLNRLEGLGLVENTELWIETRGLRNRLVHEYIEDSALLAEALIEARRFSEILFAALEKLSTASETLRPTEPDDGFPWQ
uniref:DUF86 domain-containing protein n=1 Tax=Candidatus Kentrum sp. UNK TaxID=2126344 RepID=A0A451ARU9_9GAMM|nr:MAG: hypothetical protein BECKUNK1418G_GA0071005_100723 [Candidatus Kentron sp. UNK]VFK68722.1 MAG: hypothetical protein BECKUNK1418H_GA0071006_100529 [Candidatus Kentron sp. UNK]